MKKPRHPRAIANLSFSFEKARPELPNLLPVKAQLYHSVGRRLFVCLMEVIA